MKNHIIHSDATLLQALEAINRLSGSEMTLLVTTPDGEMTGTLTDGDIRRALLRGIPLTAAATEAMHRDFSYLRDGDIDVRALKEMRRSGKHLIPVLDGRRRVTAILDTTATRTVLPMRAIIMAGGKGERLRPLTLTTPKPLVKVAGKAIIDYNIEALAAVGVKDITVTVNYLAEQLEEHFSQPVAGVNVKCVRETFPMGTIGSAALVPAGTLGATLVMNSDLLTTISYEDLYLHHAASGADITIAAIPYNVSVPYAILATDSGRVTALEEKPSYAYYANAGIYLISDSMLATLKPDCRTDATDFITDAIAAGRKVSYFPISGTWIDIGSHTDYAHACELMAHHRDLTE
ncbi:MAG: NTP transferase domain-containing protein [Duncaniella sp.]|nr:NTP transferase domain-containing protein [Duncaniella sp.]